MTGRNDYHGFDYGVPDHSGPDHGRADLDEGYRDAEANDGVFADSEFDDGEFDDPEFEDSEFDDGVAATITRRRFLAGLAASGTTGFAAFWALNRGGDVSTARSPATTSSNTTQVAVGEARVPVASEPVAEVASNLLTPAPVDQRILVLIELEGGNDGPSTVVPAGNGTYYDLRPKMSIPADLVLPIDDEVGLNPNLARLHQRQMAIIDGVGPVDGSLSHFDMVARWGQGDLYGTNGLRTGFLARVADALDSGSPAVGLSVGGYTPRFNNATASTLSVEDPNSLWVMTDDQWIYPYFRQAVGSIQGGPLTNTLANSWQRLTQMTDALPADLELDEESAMITEGGELGDQLAVAAELIRSDLGVRVVHARLAGFDTHQGHEWKHEDLMKKLDAAVDGFLQKMDEYGLADRVLVATSSEFGRRARENGNGFDHGAASTMLVFGPVVPGRYGEAPSLGDLDGDDNLKTTVAFDSYLGTLAENWLGVPAASVLPRSPELFTLI